MPGYNFDVFISYSSEGSAPKWVINHFYPKLLDCLVDQMGPRPKVFLDKTMARGTYWPTELQLALRHSKLMIAVLSPPYFRSRWCLAEWRSMRAREDLLGLAGSQRTQGLIYPILYSDSINFPKEEGAHLRSWWNFKSVSVPDPVFQRSPEWNTFHHKVNEFAEDMAQLLTQVPAWQPDWPSIEVPDPPLLKPPPLPRFGV